MYVKIEAHPGARKEMVVEKNQTLLISVREPAAGNRANDRIRELVALHYRVPLGKVRILTGHHSRSKMVSVQEG